MREPNGRDDRGRFTVGYKGGPGRPRREADPAYVDAIFTAVPLEAWVKILARAVSDAEDGNGSARNWISKLLCLDAPRKVTHAVAEDDTFPLAAVLEAAQNVTAPPRDDSEPHPNVINVAAELARIQAMASEATTVEAESADEDTATATREKQEDPVRREANQSGTATRPYSNALPKAEGTAAEDRPRRARVDTYKPSLPPGERRYVPEEAFDRLSTELKNKGDIEGWLARQGELLRNPEEMIRRYWPYIYDKPP